MHLNGKLQKLFLYRKSEKGVKQQQKKLQQQAEEQARIRIIQEAEKLLKEKKK